MSAMKVTQQARDAIVKKVQRAEVALNSARDRRDELIRADRENGTMTLRQLADIYHVCYARVYQIVNGKRPPK